MAVRDLVYKYGSQTTPTIVIDEEVITGFNPERLDQIFAE
jgi:glutaredoxin